VPPTVPRALLAAWRATHPAILVPRYDGVRGHPVLFDRRMFNEIEQLRGDVGARAVIERDPGRVLLLDVAGPVPHDVDTPSDLAALTAARTDMTSTGLDAGRPVADG
jgi:molybdenum cofactor cytidylyltransferase